jgi:hypothetical protein
MTKEELKNLHFENGKKYLSRKYNGVLSDFKCEELPDQRCLKISATDQQGKIWAIADQLYFKELESLESVLG